MNNPQPTLIYAVRHGETEWNSIGKQQGQMDSPLTERGIQQAHALAQGLAGRNIEFIYSSDLGRALKTAEIISAKLGLPVKINERLRERNLGSLQGCTWHEWQKKYPEEWIKFNSGGPDYCFPGGESARQRSKRTVECLEELVRLHNGRTILIISHSGVLCDFFYKSVNIPLSGIRRFSLFNGAINSFSVCDGSWRLDTWGEISHLKGMETLDDN